MTSSTPPRDTALLTPAEMARVDRSSVAAGVPGSDLMEAAGNAVADAVQRHWPKATFGLDKTVVVLCGPGNNGGDGFVAARHLQAAGWPVRLALLGPRSALSGDAAHHASLWTGKVEPFSVTLLDHASVVLDAIFGAGLARPVDGIALEMIQAMTTRKTPVCAVDVPSGLDGETGDVLGGAVLGGSVSGGAASAVVTVTFHRKKPGHVLLPGRTLCGELVLADIGIPESVQDSMATRTWENTPALWLSAYPWPRPNNHKYQRGHALVLGGADMTGASRLTARGAMRVGAGLVTLAVPQSVWAVYASALTGVMVRAMAQERDFSALLADTRHNAIAIGPGAGTGEATRHAVLAALAAPAAASRLADRERASARAVVLDADALTAFADEPDQLFKAIHDSGSPCVLTPHEGEFARLFAIGGDKLARARGAAALSGAVVLLKGSDTVIAEPGGRAVINTNAPADLATGGSGDVLTGFITGLLAQGMDPFHAACAATWLHGAVASAFGPGLIAEDLPEGLPAVLRQLKSGH